MLVLVERGKPEYPEQSFSEQRKDQKQTQPTYGVDAGIWTRATLEGNKTQNGEPSSKHCEAKRESANGWESDNGVSL